MKLHQQGPPSSFSRDTAKKATMVAEKMGTAEANGTNDEAGLAVGAARSERLQR